MSKEHLELITALQKAVDNLIHESDQLDIADARQQDEIDYLRKRVELLEITTYKTNTDVMDIITGDYK
mgnify:FL=1|tara:strand:- start:768 stop:971 length:204 start_codon:yes stop_codon:yes gene_type:complete